MYSLLMKTAAQCVIDLDRLWDTLTEDLPPLIRGLDEALEGEKT